jgi:UDP-GlcNAc:undecaprenyl-phosphate GlcNAc-1-phosphate transferase
MSSFFIIIVFVCSCTLAGLIIYFENHHAHLSSDHDLEGVQKFHTHPVPRIGGLPIFLALCMAAWYYHSEVPWLSILLLLSVPCFLIGLLEDVTKKISPKIRLIFTLLSAGLVAYFLRWQLYHTGFFWLDGIINIVPILWFILSVIVVSGVANAVNIIDGYHGLASMVGVISGLAFSWLGWHLNDQALIWVGLSFVACMLGFFVWNFPKGRIFLGDGGAYLIGFILAEFALYVHVQHGISPWFGLMLVAYPVTEVLVSMWRKRFVRGTPVSDPDSLHLHMLVYRRLLRHDHSKKNARTSPYLWTLHLLGVCLAFVFWDNERALQWSFIVFIAVYMYCYFSIVRFKSRWIRRLFFLSSRG